jgi:hypothetical protein
MIRHLTPKEAWKLKRLKLSARLCNTVDEEHNQGDTACCKKFSNTNNPVSHVLQINSNKKELDGQGM